MPFAADLLQVLCISCSSTYCGQEALCRLGMAVASHDIEHHESMDINATAGYAPYSQTTFWWVWNLHMSYIACVGTKAGAVFRAMHESRWRQVGIVSVMFVGHAL